MTSGEANCKYMIEQLQPFRGAVLGRPVTEDTDNGSPPEGFFGLTLKRKDGKAFVLWVNCDPEGNGPGWLDIQEI